MRNIYLKVAYKGTQYGGWQIQKNAATIQEHLSQAIHEITGEEVAVIGSGRTDAGVHAIGQTANFHTASKIPAEKFATALNTKLPSDIVICESREVDMNFHARFSARSKTYAYRFYCSEMRDPFLDDFAWQIKVQRDLNQKLNLKAMKKAAEAFMGDHDFAGFMRSGSLVKSTVRRIEYIDLSPKISRLTGCDFYELRITGNGFLYNMVRIIAGTLVSVGKGEILPENMPAIIESKDRKRSGLTAPAKGLMLMKVCY